MCTIRSLISDEIYMYEKPYSIYIDKKVWKYQRGNQKLLIEGHNNVFRSETVRQTNNGQQNTAQKTKGYTASNGAFGVIAMWSVECPFRSGWFANMVSSFAFVVIKGPSLIKIISARNQDIIMVYEAVIKVDIYGVGLANTRAQL